MEYKKIEDLDTFTLKEAISAYGSGVLPFWREAVYKKPYKLESRRYIGCKAKLIDWIFGLIEAETEDVETFCDIFAGTGSVSNRAVNLYKHVIINDFLYSNNIIYKAFFAVGDWNEDKIFDLLDAFNNIDVDSIKDNYFSINYGNKYFDMSSAKLIGHIRDVIEDIKSTLTEKEYCILIASLIYSMDRIANTLGHFEAYIKKRNKTT